MIDSPAMAKTIADAFAGDIPARSYKVCLSDAGAPRWEEQVDGKVLVHDEEPGAGFWRRFSVFLISLLPIEWLL